MIANILKGLFNGKGTLGVATARPNVMKTIERGDKCLTESDCPILPIFNDAQLTSQQRFLSAFSLSLAF